PRGQIRWLSLESVTSTDCTIETRLGLTIKPPQFAPTLAADGITNRLNVGKHVGVCLGEFVAYVVRPIPERDDPPRGSKLSIEFLPIDVGKDYICISRTLGNPARSLDRCHGEAVSGGYEPTNAIAVFSASGYGSDSNSAVRCNEILDTHAPFRMYSP